MFITGFAAVALSAKEQAPAGPGSHSRHERALLTGGAPDRAVLSRHRQGPMQPMAGGGFFD
jgi:hypothetical protein